MKQKTTVKKEERFKEKRKEKESEITRLEKVDERESAGLMFALSVTGKGIE